MERIRYGLIIQVWAENKIKPFDDKYKMGNNALPFNEGRCCNWYIFIIKNYKLC